jgi:hypothetical protein
MADTLLHSSLTSFPVPLGIQVTQVFTNGFQEGQITYQTYSLKITCWLPFFNKGRS